MTDNKIIYVIQVCRGDKLDMRYNRQQRVIIRETWSDIDDYITDWLSRPHQPMENLQVSKIVFIPNSIPKITLVKVI